MTQETGGKIFPGVNSVVIKYSAKAKMVLVNRNSLLWLKIKRTPTPRMTSEPERFTNLIYRKGVL